MGLKANSSPRLLSIHFLELKPGVTAEQFEAFLAQEFHNQQGLPGARNFILKCDRGDRVGSYALLMESDVESRDRAFPSPGVMSPETQQWADQLPASATEFDTRFYELASGVGEHFSDYVVIAEEAEHPS
jgi:hypothetical protein